MKKFVDGLTKAEILKMIPGFPDGSFWYWRKKVGLVKIGERRIGRGTHDVYPPNAAALIYKAWVRRDPKVGRGWKHKKQK